MFHVHRKAGFALLIACLLVLAVWGFAHTAHTAYAAPGSTYYVNNLPEANCSDSYDGTAETAPWCSFTPVNSKLFGPGDKVLLARGAQWNQEMVLSGSGSADQWAELGAYGSGARPRIIRNGGEQERAIRMVNPSYWKVSGLEVSHAGTGIHVLYTTLMNEGLSFSDLYVHDIKGIHHGSGSGAQDRIWNSAGIEFTSAAGLKPGASQYFVRNVILADIEGTRNLDTVSVDWYNGSGGSYAARDFVLDGLYFHDNTGTGSGCDDGMRLTSVDNLVLMNSIFDGDASCPSPTGTASIYAAGLTHSGMYNNIVKNVKDTGSPDMAGVDYECCFNDFRVSGNYFADNAGAGLSILAIHGNTWDFSSNHLISANTFVGQGKGSVRRAGNDLVPGGIIRDNLYHEPVMNTFLYQDSADFQGFQISNNRGISVREQVYHAAEQFAGTAAGAWSYQYGGTNGEWVNMAYDQSRAAWMASQTADAWISRFLLHPSAAAGSAVARVWTAPEDGTVSIRGRALLSAGEPEARMTAAVWHNQAAIIAPLEIADGHGAETNRDEVQVQAGDRLIFQVHRPEAGDAAVSWVPAVAYTHYVKKWEFETEGGTQGWTVSAPATVQAVSGSLQGTAASGLAFLSPDELKVDLQASRVLVVGLTNNTPATRLMLYYATSESPGFTEERTIEVPIYANSLAAEYAVDIRQIQEAGGTLEQLRLEFGQVTGMVAVDYIRLGDHGATRVGPEAPEPYEARRWEFQQPGDMEGWALSGPLQGTVQSGALKLASTGGDPKLFSPPELGLDTSVSSYVTIRMKSDVTSFADVFFITNEDQAWDAAKNVHFQAQGGGEWTEYRINMKNSLKWLGTVKQLRVDPVSGPGNVEVDYIAISTSLSPEDQAAQPQWPAGSRLLVTEAAPTSVLLSWPELPGGAAAGYKIFANGIEKTSVAGTAASCRVTGLTAGSYYVFAVKGYTADGRATPALSAAASTLRRDEPYYAKRWSFDTAGNTEGWTLKQLTGTVADGKLSLVSASSDPNLYSPDQLGVDAETSTYLVVRMKSSVSGMGDVFFTTQSATGFSSERNVRFQVTGDDEWREYRIDMKTGSGWNGTIKQLRLDPISSAGQVEIDFIGITSIVEPGIQ
ncbi:MAG: hypothetical protein K0Q90_3095 [Paenibacillaceae bacterium]|nr:hypothetical protein [Paenibacillaceae bacterium]